MKKILEADQDRPYNLMKNHLLHGKQYKELLAIAKNNRPDLEDREFINMFKRLANTGCSAAMLANVIAEQLYTNDLEFEKMFGFSLAINRDYLDYNKILVDIFSRLYKIGKVRFIEYSEYAYSSSIEAVEKLFEKEMKTDSEAVLYLFDHGLIANGYDEKGKKLFKSIKPKITDYVGSCLEIAKSKFGLDGVNSFDELKKICDQKHIEMTCKDLEIHEKFTGLGTNNFNFWCNYYFQSHKLDITLSMQNIILSDFHNDYASFQEYILQLISNGYSISVSSGVNSDVYMHTNKQFSWQKISTEQAGHIMSFKRFSHSGDIIVSSYGKDYIIPKEYFNLLEFRKMHKIDVGHKFQQEEISEHKMK